jgi:hypothetical protein
MQEPVSLCKSKVQLDFCTAIDLLIREKGALTPVEIESAATLSTDFVMQLEWFQTLGVKRVTTGAVLYNDERSFNIRGV